MTDEQGAQDPSQQPQPPSSQVPPSSTHQPEPPGFQPPPGSPQQQTGWQPPSQPSRRKRSGLKIALAVAGGAVALVVVLVIGIAIGTAGKSTGGKPAAASASPSVQAFSPTPSPLNTQFVSDMRTTFNFDSSVSDDDLSSFGTQVCSDMQAQTPFTQEVGNARQQWSHTSPGDGIQMIRLAEQDICPGQLKPETITYQVTGNVSADVTYGPSGSNFQGSVPMKVTKHLGNPSYYAINAQLNGDGTVHCKLKVDGVTLASGTASGAYNIASCQIGQDPITNSWENES